MIKMKRTTTTKRIGLKTMTTTKMTKNTMMTRKMAGKAMDSIGTKTEKCGGMMKIPINGCTRRWTKKIWKKSGAKKKKINMRKTTKTNGRKKRKEKEEMKTMIKKKERKGKKEKKE